MGMPRERFGRPVVPWGLPSRPSEAWTPEGALYAIHLMLGFRLPKSFPSEPELVSLEAAARQEWVDRGETPEARVRDAIQEVKWLMGRLGAVDGVD